MSEESILSIFFFFFFSIAGTVLTTPIADLVQHERILKSYTAFSLSLALGDIVNFQRSLHEHFRVGLWRKFTSFNYKFKWHFIIHTSRIRRSYGFFFIKLLCMNLKHNKVLRGFTDNNQIWNFIISTRVNVICIKTNLGATYF